MIQITCRQCDLVLLEEPDSPNPPGYRLFKCEGCGCRVGLQDSDRIDRVHP